MTRSFRLGILQYVLGRDLGDLSDLWGLGLGILGILRSMLYADGNPTVSTDMKDPEITRTECTYVIPVKIPN